MPEFLIAPTPHNEAIDFIRSKPVVSRAVFDRLLPELQARAFTIAGAIPADVLQHARDLIAGLPAGQPWDKQKAQIAGLISPYLVDPEATPEERAAQEAAATAKAELLLRVHGHEAYSAAAWQVMDRQRNIFEYWQYQSMRDERVRPTHAALDGLVLPASSPFWQTHFPPWDWGCRCIAIPLSDSSVNAIRRADAQRPQDERLVLEGPLLRELEQNHRLVRGMNNIVNVQAPADAGKAGAFRFNPADARLTVEQLKGRYDAPTWNAFESWARKTPIGENQTTVWEWMNGDAIIPQPAVFRVPPPAAAPGPTPIEKKELQIVLNKTESAHIFGPDGKLVFSRQGTRSQVLFSTADVQQMKDTVLTHNHPRGSSLSFADVHLAFTADLAEVRAIGRAANGRTFLYSMQRPEAGWSRDELPRIIGRYKLIMEEVRIEVRAAILAGRMTPEEARSEGIHRVMQKLAERYPGEIIYERTEIETI